MRYPTDPNYSRADGLKGLANVGIITALPKEYVAVQMMLDRPVNYPVPGTGAGRQYCLGEVSAARGRHIVALALTPEGNNLATARAVLLLEHFPSVEWILMVGIAGGVPNPNKAEEHVRLGDIVVSNKKGVVQYDFVKEARDKPVEHRHSPRPPSARLLEAAQLLNIQERRNLFPWLDHFRRTHKLRGSSRPSLETDRLRDCEDRTRFIEHPTDPERFADQPRVFLGPIASANALLKDCRKRDLLRDAFGVKAVEMEGSGIADGAWNQERGYLVVRGVCDYCDEDKGDRWQQYAAVAAAAYARALLESIPAGPRIQQRGKLSATPRRSVSRTRPEQHNRTPRATQTIICGVSQKDSEFSRDRLLVRAKKALLLAGSNLRTWLNDSTTVEGLVKSIQAGKSVTIVIATADVLRQFGAGSDEDLKQSIQDIYAIWGRLTREERSRLRVYSHFGSSTLSATFCDPDDDDAIVVFNPRWAIDYLADKRIFCVISKGKNRPQYNAMRDSLSLMTQPRFELLPPGG